MLLYNYIIGLMLFQYFVISFILFTLVHIHKYSMAITYFSFLNLYLGISFFFSSFYVFIYLFIMNPWWGECCFCSDNFVS